MVLCGLVLHGQGFEAVKNIKPKCRPVLYTEKNSQSRQKRWNATQVQVVHMGQRAMIPCTTLVFVLLKQLHDCILLHIEVLRVLGAPRLLADFGLTRVFRTQSGVLLAITGDQ